MYRTILLILYLFILIPSLAHLIRYRDIPSSRRWGVGLGVAGIVLAPTFASFLCELIASIFSIALLFLILLSGICMLVKSIFR